MFWEPKRVRLAGVACLAIVVVATGCGGDTIDTSELEGEIKKDLAADVGITPEAIDCPEDIEIRAGTKFECRGTAPPDSSRFTIDVELTDDDGGFEAVVPPEQFN